MYTETVFSFICVIAGFASEHDLLDFLRSPERCYGIPNFVVLLYTMTVVPTLELIHLSKKIDLNM